MANGLSMDRPAQRAASMTSVRPERRRAQMARLRSAAMTLGPDRVLTCDLSSWYRVSQNGASEVTQSPIAHARARAGLRR